MSSKTGSTEPYEGHAFSSVQPVNAGGRVNLPEPLTAFLSWMPKSHEVENILVKCIATLGRRGGLQMDVAGGDIDSQRTALLRYMRSLGVQVETFDKPELFDAARFFSASWPIEIRHESKGKTQRGTFYFKIPDDVIALGLLQKPKIHRTLDELSETTEEYKASVYISVVSNIIEVLPISEEVWPTHGLAMHLRTLAENRERWIQITKELLDNIEVPPRVE